MQFISGPDIFHSFHLLHSSLYSAGIKCEKRQRGRQLGEDISPLYPCYSLIRTCYLWNLDHKPNGFAKLNYHAP